MDDINNLWVALQSRIEEIGKNSPNLIAGTIQSISAVQSVLISLKEIILKRGFSNLQEEISFFKNELPKYYSLLYYFTYVHKLESRMPFGVENRVKLIEREIKHLNYSFEENSEWVIYYRNDSTHLDDKYFIRQQDSSKLPIDFDVLYDERFSSVGTLQFSKLKAQELIQSYLDDKLAHLQHPSATLNSNSKVKTQLRWTASKSDLIELLYALHSSNLFNNNDFLDVKQIATWLETTLNVNLGNYYRVFQGIRIRKKNRTQFIDTLKENLIKRMDEADENPRY